MNYYISCLFSVGLFFATCSSYAETTTVHNETTDSIDVFFQAWGCFGVERPPYMPRICYARKSLKRNESASYIWKGGQSGNTVLIRTLNNIFEAKRLKPTLSWKGFKFIGESTQPVSISDDFKWRYTLTPLDYEQ